MRALLIVFFLFIGRTECGIAQQQIHISGKILGHNGEPLPQAHVWYTPFSNSDSIHRALATPQGNFSITSEQYGQVELSFTGVGHGVYNTYLFLFPGDSVELTVYLGGYRLLPNYDSVGIIGDFNHFDMESARPLVPHGNGIYTFNYVTDADTLGYQLVNIATGYDGSRKRIAGTGASRYYFDEWSDYISVADAQQGIVYITFDSTKIVGSNAEPHILFTNSRCPTAQLFIASNNVSRLRSELYAKKLSGKEYLRQLQEHWELEEENSFAQTLYKIEYVTSRAPGIDSSIARTLLHSISPDSLLWGYSSRWMGGVAWVAYPGYENEQRKQYARSVIKTFPEPDFAATFLMMEIGDAFYARAADFDTLYNWMMRDYPNTSAANKVNTYYAPDRTIQEGRPVPDFALRDIDDTTVTVSRQSLLGAYYLIDFWATWCGPCIAEMEYLHKADSLFSGPNFRIISVSLDNTPLRIRKFRKERWPMPWFHGNIPEEFDAPMAHTFDIQGIPTTLLVNDTGTIIATRSNLVGPGLLQTLARLLPTQTAHTTETR